MTKCNLCGGDGYVPDMSRTTIGSPKRICPSCHGNQPKELLTLTEYQHQAAKTATWEEFGFDVDPIYYCALGLVGEAGEIANKVKKVIRGDYDKDALREILKGELGDLGWYWVILARELDLDAGDIAQSNLDKLASRQERGVIKGSGDER